MDVVYSELVEAAKAYLILQGKPDAPHIDLCIELASLYPDLKPEDIKNIANQYIAENFVHSTTTLTAYGGASGIAHTHLVHIKDPTKTLKVLPSNPPIIASSYTSLPMEGETFYDQKTNNIWVFMKGRLNKVVAQ